MTISDVLNDDVELAAVIPEVVEEEGDKCEPEKLSDEFPTMAQSVKEWTRIESKGKKLAHNQSNPKEDPISSSMNPRLTGDELLHKFENVCYFYKIGKCKFGKECKKDHPKFCQKFITHGPQKLNPKGCDCKCHNLHPIACRDSIKNRKCGREKFRFYHLKGTKKIGSSETTQTQSTTPVINAQIKLSEMWKSVNLINYPIKTNLVTHPDVYV